MKTIFRYTNIGLLVAAIFALGAVGSFAQDDPCADAATKTALDAKFRENYGKKDIASRKIAVDAGKQYLEKFASCPDSADFGKYLKDYLPGMETKIAADEKQLVKDALVARFDNALKTKNWDEAYASGKQILANYQDEFRTVEIVLASIGGEEAFKNNFKYNDDALKFAKQSIADLDAGKSFKVGKETRYGLSLKDNTGKVVYNFSYPTKEDALGWLNLYIGYMIQVGQKDKAAALPYLFKASQATASDASKNSTSFDLIGSYYIDELNKLYDEIQALAKTQSDTDTEEVAKQKLEAIKAKVALANGTAERAMDAYARASKIAQDAAIKARTRKSVEDIYKRRFEKTEGVDGWIASTIVKPFPNPTTPVTPISDPEPAKPTTTTTSTAPVTTPVTTAKPTTTTTVKPAPATGTKPAGPAAKPVSGTKPAAVGKKTVKRKW